MGKQTAPNIVRRLASSSKDTTPPGQLPTGSRAARRHSGGKRMYPGGLVHVVQVWTEVPHPRYGAALPHYVPSYLPCLSDHRNTRECYVRRGSRRRQS